MTNIQETYSEYREEAILLYMGLVETREFKAHTTTDSAGMAVALRDAGVRILLYRMI